MALLGHRTPAMAAHNTRGANQKHVSPNPPKGKVIATTFGKRIEVSSCGTPLTY